MSKWIRGNALLLACASLLLSVAVVPAGAADTEDEQWAVPQDSSATFHGLVLQNSVDFLGSFSYLLASNGRKRTKETFDRFVCTSTSDPNCGTKNDITDFSFNAVLPPCETSSQTDCVESLYVLTGSGVEAQATFLRYVAPKHPNLYPADSKIKLPRGSSPSIWSIPSAPHAFGDEYAINVAASGSIDAVHNSLYGYTLGAMITPVSTLAGGAADLPACRTIQQASRGNHYNNGCNSEATPVGADYKCAYASPGSAPKPDCLLQHAFPADVRFGLKLRLASEPVAWLHGRMSDPSISIAKEGTGGVAVNVSAYPTRVPTLYYGAKWNDLGSDLQAWFRKCDEESQTFRCSGLGDHGLPTEQRTGSMAMQSYGDAALAAVTVLNGITGNSARVSPSAWSFTTLPDNQLGSSKCIIEGDGVKGFVTTNSTAYSEGPPVLAGGYLNYKVAAPHFDSKGNVFHGDYSLVIRSDVARCLYKFSNAPISASVSVVSESGSNEVATTATTERNGWLYMRASNFTFSSPTVKVKLSQSASPAVAKKTTITCVKGKTVKKVTAIKPTCPAGYKRKA